MSPRRPTLPRGLAALAVLAATAALAVGCRDGSATGTAAGDGEPSPTVSTSPSAAPSPTSPTASVPTATRPTPAPTLTLPTVRPPGPEPTGTTTVVDGVARPGVEAGCTVLAGTDGRTWLLLGANGGTPDQQKIPLGVPIRVRGVQVDQIVSYCQQGTPLEIVEVTRR